MSQFTRTELEGAQKAILSTIHKCEKAQQTLSQKQSSGSPQLTSLHRSLKALNLASSFIGRELNEDFINDYSKEDLEEALQSIASLVHQVERIRPKLKEGTSQHTLLIRRIKAFHIASVLIENELSLVKKS